jgi:hypothetical protein
LFQNDDNLIHSEAPDYQYIPAMTPREKPTSGVLLFNLPPSSFQPNNLSGKMTDVSVFPPATVRAGFS